MKKPIQQRITVTLNGAGKKKGGGAKGKAAPSRKKQAPVKKKVNKRR